MPRSQQEQSSRSTRHLGHVPMFVAVPHIPGPVRTESGTLISCLVQLLLTSARWSMASMTSTTLCSLAFRSRSGLNTWRFDWLNTVAKTSMNAPASALGSNAPTRCLHDRNHMRFCSMSGSTTPRTRAKPETSRCSSCQGRPSQRPFICSLA